MHGNDNKTVEGGPDRGAPEVVTQFHPYIEMATPAPHMQKVGNAEIPWWDCFGEVFLAEIPWTPSVPWWKPSVEIAWWNTLAGICWTPLVDFPEVKIP